LLDSSKACNASSCAALQLDNLANPMKKGIKITNHYMASKPLAGTKLICEFQGDLHEVLVSKNDFIYQLQENPLKGLKLSGPTHENKKRDRV
jgi:hypothetical protein